MYKRKIENQLLTKIKQFQICIWRRKLKLIAVVCLFLGCFICYKKIPEKLEVSVIDVGQGDCSLISTPEHKTILIDGGGSQDTEKYDVGKRVLLPYLLNHNSKTTKCKNAYSRSGTKNTYRKRFVF